MTTLISGSALPLLALTLVLSACSTSDSLTREDQPAANTQATAEEAALVQYLEIVTSEVDATCAALEQIHGVEFGEADPNLGNARTAALEGGGRIGVRAPLAEHEQPVVRPYALVDDIESALAAAQAAGGQVAMPSTDIPNGGKFAIYFLGGIQHGLYQL